MMPGPWELILILLIVVVVFGAKRIPEIMGGLGQGVRSFKKAMEGDETPSAPPYDSSGSSPSTTSASSSPPSAPQGGAGDATKEKPPA